MMNNLRCFVRWKIWDPLETYYYDTLRIFRNIFFYYDVLRKDRDYCYEPIFIFLIKKLKSMEKSIRLWDTHVESTKVANQIRTTYKALEKGLNSEESREEKKFYQKYGRICMEEDMSEPPSKDPQISRPMMFWYEKTDKTNTKLQGDLRREIIGLWQTREIKNDEEIKKALNIIAENYLTWWD